MAWACKLVGRTAFGLLLAELAEDLIHDPGGENNFAVRNWDRLSFGDGTVERLNQVLQAGLHVEVVSQESGDVLSEIPEVLSSKLQRRNELLEIALISFPSQFNENLLILIEDETVPCTVNTELVKGGAHLRREREISGDATGFMNDDSQFINDFPLAHTLQQRAYESVRDDLRRFGGQELCDTGDAVADSILQEFPRQSANPVRLVGQKRCCIRAASESVTEVAFHVHWPAAQEPALDKSSHASRHMRELTVMAGGDLEVSLLRQCDQSRGFFRIEREWLLDVNVTSRFETEARNIEMACWRGCDMDNVRPCFPEKIPQVGERSLNWKPLAKLARH